MSNKDRPGRGRSNSDERGSAAQRRRRKQWLLEQFGDGEKAPCHAPASHGGICGTLVDFATMIVGRVVPGCHGGRYIRGNIRPECVSCSTHEGQGRTTALRVTRPGTQDTAGAGAGVAAAADSEGDGMGATPDCSCGMLQRECPCCSGAV